VIIAPELLREYKMNEEQKAIVSHKQGPLLVIAGPGSVKTRSLTLLTMNLLLCNDAEPSQVVLCTYTEKAAFELQDRLTSIANGVGYKGNLSQLKVGTIHSICQQLVNENLYRTPLGNNYETLDQFTQQLLIFEHLGEICPDNTQAFFRKQWGAPWNIAKKLKFYFDTIAEELIFDKLKEEFLRLRRYAKEKDILLYCLTHAYYHYQHVLARTNSIDFAHLQKCAFNLLTEPDTFQRITRDQAETV
jgi:DNA helicase II / ATP-dependent DNA helicase PcrA